MSEKQEFFLKIKTNKSSFKVRQLHPVMFVEAEAGEYKYKLGKKGEFGLKMPILLSEN